MKNESHDRQNRWSGFKVGPLITLVLVLSIIIPIPFFSTAAGKFKPKEPCSLTVLVDSEDGYKDLDIESLVIDLYKVAETVPYDRSDGFTFKMLDPFQELKIEEEMTASDLSDLTQQAAKIIFDNPTGNASVNPVASGKTGEPIKKLESGQNLESGLYLLVVRSTDDRYAENENYVVKTKEGNIVTRGYSYNNSYIFPPQLVSLPTKLDAKDTVSTSNTADEGDWEYNIQVYLKAERENASLRIIKTIDKILVDGETETVVPVTFTFDVEAKVGSYLAYSNVVTISFDGSGTEESVEIIKKIPVGATVTVTEVDSGARYTGEVVGNDSATIASNLVFTEFKFDNKYNGRQTDGHGITNRFIYENGEWRLEKIEDRSQEVEDGSQEVEDESREVEDGSQE